MSSRSNRGRVTDWIHCTCSDFTDRMGVQFVDSHDGDPVDPAEQRVCLIVDLSGFPDSAGAGRRRYAVMLTNEALALAGELDTSVGAIEVRRCMAQTTTDEAA